MKLEMNALRYLSKDDFRVLTAVEMGMRNHEIVPAELVDRIAGLKDIHLRELENPDDVFDTILGLIVRLAEHGLIRCDFNEFNIMINDDEKIAVIDFPQMVSVSHRNAQMFFDQDIECIYKFFKKRYNLSSEKSEDQDGFESDGEENGRPSFLSVKRAAGFLDKELAASGFTRKEQVEMEKFIEEDVEEHNSSSDDDDSTSEQGCSQINDAVPVKIDSLIIADQEPADEPDFNLALSDSDGPGTFSKEHGASTSSSGENKLENPSSSSNGDAKEPLESEGKTLSQDDDNDDDLSEDPDDEDDAALARQLNKQRRKATAAAHGRRRPLSSRNAYNDKGKGTMNSKIQRQACKW